ncbi:MAG TPA: aminotransferase class I/II-fold pyridoxal phosphate-dependent enzyme [Stellaceae bacterium]|nr:aminotransferase class I/II-fold pyridoxal phosphate-dependent enzyme [Stellaceae bacterium]
MTDLISAQWLTSHLTDRTTRGIATTTGALIRSGAIAVGMKLPAVRELALALGVSPATISAAWSELRKFKVISGRGRTGIWVCGDRVTPRPLRYEEVGNYGARVLDLSSAAPDPALLPALAEALRYGANAVGLNSYERVPILDGLAAAIRPGWPYPAEAFLATNGGYDAVYVTLQTLIRPGSAVAIEDPTAMRLLDILDNLGAQVIPVVCDEEGPDPASLATALAGAPAAFVYQPRTHSVTGRVVGADRMVELARVLRHSETLIVEDDGLGALSAVPPRSLGRVFPDRTVHIHSYSKSLGPDLRLAVLSSSTDIVKQIQAYRSFGAGWTSRILQATASWLIRDPETTASIDRAQRVYAERRRSLIAALDARGVSLPDRDGLCLWVPVRSEQFAIVTMAARGIAVLPGRKCTIRPSEHVRVATSLLTHEVDAAADALSLAR